MFTKIYFSCELIEVICLKFHWYVWIRPSCLCGTPCIMLMLAEKSSYIHTHASGCLITACRCWNTLLF
jgi:hypothetical protein